MLAHIDALRKERGSFLREVGMLMKLALPILTLSVILVMVLWSLRLGAAAGAVSNTDPAANHTLPHAPLLSVTPATPVPSTTPPTATYTPTACPGAWHHIEPQAGAPPSGGTVAVGQRFVLDLMVNSGPYTDVAAQQAYLTFSHTLMQNINVDQPGCVITNRVRFDGLVFDYILQNEVCNGPNPCVFRYGGNTAPGSIAFISVSLGNPATGGDFRVAEIGLCAIAPGQARLRWEFGPPDPPFTRSTIIFNENNDPVQATGCYVEYVINIVPNTPTITPTPSPFLVGHVTWQGPPAQPHERQQLPISVTLKMGETEVNYPQVATDANGTFTLDTSSLPAGTYAWRAKGPRYLAEAGTIMLTGSGTIQVEMGLMRAGDANDDNVANISDFNILKDTFGTPMDLKPDFNNDSLVNAADFNLLRMNFGQGGAPPISP